MSTKNNPNLHNPHLEGDAFLWQNGPVGVCLLHGYTATTAEVRPLAERLQKAGYSVAAPLLPGHGTTPADLNRVRWQTWVEHSMAALDRLAKTCTQVFIGGQSLGGVVALYVASQRPQIGGVLLYAPAISLNMTLLDRLKLYLGAPFLPEVPRESLDCSEQWQGYPNLPLKGAIQLLRLQRATRSHLSDIQQPVLVFQGRLDTTVSPQAGDIILQGIRSQDKTRLWLEKSHHPLILDDEIDELTQHTLAFLARHTTQ